jgi:citrate synthase
LRSRRFFVNVDEINVSTWVSSEEACERLGIRSQTLYAYVSRGRLTPRREGRRSLFDVRELDDLAARGRRSTRAGKLEVLIDTEITLLDRRGALFYRGVDVTAIAGAWSFERTAEWLWSGRDDEPHPGWHAPDEWLALARAAVGERPADRLRVAAAALGTVAEPSVDAVSATGRALIPALVAALPSVGRSTGDTSIAAQLWPRLTARPASPERLALLDAALVLLADHEMAVSTVAARVAASAWASPAACVLAGLAAHSGVLHGAESTRAVEALRRGDGDLSRWCGHIVYEGDDPRTNALLDLLAETPVRRAIRGCERPNVDLALAALALEHEMIDGAAEAIFAVARTAGWLAHAAEEYERPFRFRPRASYVGPAPLR